jgi:hypothetical protein
VTQVNALRPQLTLVNVWCILLEYNIETIISNDTKGGSQYFIYFLFFQILLVIVGLLGPLMGFPGPYS